MIATIPAFSSSGSCIINCVVIFVVFVSINGRNSVVVNENVIMHRYYYMYVYLCVCSRCVVYLCKLNIMSALQHLYEYPCAYMYTYLREMSKYIIKYTSYILHT